MNKFVLSKKDNLNELLDKLVTNIYAVNKFSKNISKKKRKSFIEIIIIKCYNSKNIKEEYWNDNTIFGIPGIMNNNIFEI